VVVDFPRPEESERLRLWQINLSAEMPRAGDEDLEFLAHAFDLSGGNIRNVCLCAAFLAADAGRLVSMGDLVRGVVASRELIQILARAYYASRDTKTPLALTLISIGTNITLSVLLAPLYGINGLAIANSIATLAEAGLFLALLAPRARLRNSTPPISGPKV